MRYLPEDPEAGRAARLRQLAPDNRGCLDQPDDRDEAGPCRASVDVAEQAAHTHLDKAYETGEAGGS